MGQEVNKFKNFAFISYSHKDIEEAKRLEQFLCDFRLPVHIKEKYPDRPEKFKEIFRDNSSMNACPDLNAEIKRHLDESEYLFVVCSPYSAQSPWVKSEIEYFKEKRGFKYIYPFVVSGVVNADKRDPEQECIPEPLGRPYKGRAANISTYSFEHAIIEIIADIIQLDVDEIWQRHIRLEEERKQKLKEQNDKLQISQSRFLAEKANQLVDEGDSYTARLLALKALPKDLDNPDRPYVAEAEAAIRNATMHNSAILRGHNSDVIDALFSPTGDFILSFSKDKTIRLWSVSDGGCTKTFNGDVDTVSLLSNNSNYFVSAKTYGYKDFKIWDFEKAEPIEEKKLELRTRFLCFSHDGKYLFAIKYDELKIWETRNGDIVKVINKDDFNNLSSIAISPNGRIIACGFKDNLIKILDVETENFIITFKGHSRPVDSLIFSYNGDLLASSSWKTIILWNASMALSSIKPGGICDNYTIISDEEEYNNRVLSFSPDGKELISTSKNKAIKIWNIDTKKCKSLSGHMHEVNSARYNSANNLFVSSSEDKTIRLWDCFCFPDYKITPLPHHFFAYKVSFNSDCTLVAAIDDKSVKIYDVNSGKEEQTLEGHEKQVTSVDFAPGRRMLVTTSIDGTVRVWNTDNNSNCVIDKSKDLNEFAVFSNDSKFIVTSSEKVLKLWNVGTIWDNNDKPLNTFECNNSIATALFVSMEKKIIAIDMYGYLYEWDFSGNSENKSLPIRIFEGIVVEGKMTISPNGELISLIPGIEGVHDPSIYLWNRKEKYRRILTEHRGSVTSANFDSSGKLLVSSSEDKTIRIWDVASGICLKTFWGHTYDVKDAVFSKDNLHVISISIDKTIIKWDFPSLQELIDNTYERFRNRKLTFEEKKKYYLE